MDYPHGHNPHHHRHHDRRDEEYPPPGQPPYYGGNDPPPPFPPPSQVYHSSHVGPGPAAYPPQQVYHSSHVGPGPAAYPPQPRPAFADYGPPPPVVEPPHHRPEPAHHGPQRPHSPPGVHHHTHHGADELANKPSVRVYSKAETNYSLTIRDGKVILTRSDPADPCQHWIKDEKFSTRVKDEEGLPSFALVNKATRQAMKHATGATHPVQLIPYNPNALDESILWTDKDLGDGYRAIRMVNNIRLNVDAFHGDKNHGGVREGTQIYLWEWKKGDNQRWKIVPS